MNAICSSSLVNKQPGGLAMVYCSNSLVSNQICYRSTSFPIQIYRRKDGIQVMLPFFKYGKRHLVMNGELGLWSQSETVNCFECKTITFMLGSEDQGSPKKAKQNKKKKNFRAFHDHHRVHLSQNIETVTMLLAASSVCQHTAIKENRRCRQCNQI